MPLQRDTEANHRRLDGGEFARERGDVLRRHARHFLDIVGRELGRALGELGGADGMLLHPLAIDMAVSDHRGHDAHGERAVGAGFRHDVPIGLLGRARAVGIDHDDLRAALLRFEHERPVMQIGRDRVAGPDDDIPGMDEAFRIDPAGRAYGQEPRGRGARSAERLLVDGRAEPIEEGVARRQPLHQTFIAEIGVRHDRLAAVARDDLLPALGDLGDGFVPGDAGELPRALRADAAQRVEHAIGIVVVVVIVLELDAEPPTRHRVLLVASDLDQPPALDLVDHGAGIGAVMRTSPEELRALWLVVHGFETSLPIP
jgi:hypothetical protein